MGWGLLVGSRLHSWHNTGQKLLLLRKIPKPRTATVGLWVHTFNLARFVTYLCSESASATVNHLCIASVEHKVICEGREELPVHQSQWTWQEWGAQPWEGTGCCSDCVTLAPCRDLAGAQPDSSSEQVGRCCFVSLLRAPASAKPSCSPLR